MVRSRNNSGDTDDKIEKVNEVHGKQAEKNIGNTDNNINSLVDSLY